MSASLASFTDSDSRDDVQDTEGASPISVFYHQCIEGYQNLSEKLRNAAEDDPRERAFDRDEKLRVAQDSRLRFRAWAVNIVAHQKCHLRSSLDFRVLDEASENRLTVPSPPKMVFEGIPFEYGEPFERPELTKNGKHVFQDLGLYVCAFEECNMGMFRSRNEWFADELQNHRRQWLCVRCATPFPSKTAFLAHLVPAHPCGSSKQGQSLLEDTPRAVEADKAENNKNQADNLEEAKGEVAEEKRVIF
ncbi:hypothetical protein F5884DRAFT_887228 [Xylogone sp. PMI_703]|nr:hypothetical protein F5884DRAFT_887228 [Xylogone sp. PMI_703]